MKPMIRAKHAFLLLPLLAACSDKPAPAPKGAPASTARAPQTDKSIGMRDGGAGRITDAAVDAGAVHEGPKAGALYLHTPVMSDMEWPRRDDDDEPKRRKKPDDARSKVVHLGYLRHGGKVSVVGEPHEKANCKEGWYELVSGGFVCGKHITLDLNHPRLKAGPKMPDFDANLPYLYGYNVTNGTPLYRTVPSRESRAKFEPWLAGGSRKKAKRPERDDDGEGSGSGLTLTGSRQSDELDAGVPWYLRDHDGGKPMVTLEELRESEGGPIARRMVKGFYVSLDQDMTANGARWWKTQSGFTTPFDRIYIQKPLTEYHGVWLNDAAESHTDPGVDGGAPIAAPARVLDLSKNPKAGVGFVLWTKAKKYTVDADKKHVTPGDPLPRFSTVMLTGESANIGGNVYEETTDGFWMKTNEGTRTRPGDPPKDLAAREKWIDVNLERQTMVAFEGDKPVYASLFSSGKRNYTDKEKDHPTPPGSFRIREKHIAATMDGDVASDGPYSIEDVPYIMYFNASYALHAAFWHSNFGHTQSHGCVNLAPADAKAMFGWTEPHLPEGWHGVNSTPEKPGTRVVVHGDDKGR